MFLPICQSGQFANWLANLPISDIIEIIVYNRDIKLALSVTMFDEKYLKYANCKSVVSLVYMLCPYEVSTHIYTN